MTTVRVEAIHPKCMANMLAPAAEIGCGCKEWEGHQSWWLCEYHSAFNDGCWAVADAEPTTIGQMFDAMGLLSLPCAEQVIDLKQKLDEARTLAWKWRNDAADYTASPEDTLQLYPFPWEVTK